MLHLRILRDAGLVSVRAEAQRRVYAIESGPLSELDAWLAPYREPVVRFERTFDQPVATVWAAVTGPAELEAWFPTTVELSGLAPSSSSNRATRGTACRLALTVVLEGAEKAARDAAGWEQCLDMLETVAAGETPQRRAPSEGWRAYYQEHQRLGLPATAPIPESHTVSE